MLLYRSMLAISNKEKSCIFIIDSGGSPLLILDIIWNLISCVSLAADHKQDVLKVFTVYTCILVRLKHSIKVIQLLILLNGELLLQETHFVHQKCNTSDIKFFFHWLNIWLSWVSSSREISVLNAQELCSELSFEPINSEGFWFFRAIVMIGHSGVL